MTPKQLARSGSEHAHQVALFAWAAMAQNKGFRVANMWASSGNICNAESNEPVQCLRWIHAIPNGGSRGDSALSRAIRGGQLKAEGVKTGVADIFLPYPAYPWHGLYIEMKKPSQKPKRGGKGGLSDSQIEFKNYVQTVGYGYAVCYSWNEAAKVIQQYVESAG